MWARSLGPHIFCCLQFNLDDVRAELDEAKYAVFDDMQGGFKFFPSYKGWLGAQRSFTVSDKYKQKFTVQWGRPTIWLCNEKQWSDDCRDEKGQVLDVDWLYINAHVVHLTEPIFRASTE